MRANTRAIRLFATVVSSAAITAGVVVTSAAPAAASGTYSTTGTINVRYGPGTGYGIITTISSGTSFTLVCQWQGGTNVNGNSTWDEIRFANGVGAIADYWTTTPSWNSYAPNTPACPTITTQMQNAANWAIAEKNSPDPTWSDHFGHPWSGYCEQFAEQAENFAFFFGTAMDNFNWQNSHGRIHSDANPPPGALTFYGGAGGAGHVAVSVGDGQEIGTLGYAGQRLPVSQYAVTGFISDYRGWALPIGS